MNTFRPLTTRLALTLLLAVASVAALAAQTLNVYNVNTSAFPRITADYVAFDQFGSQMTGLVANDFTVVETATNGSPVSVTPTVQHACDTSVEEPQISVLIILDRSNSMDDNVGGIRRFRYAQDAITAFVNKIKFVGETQVCFTTFSGTFEIATPWTNDPKKVTDTLMRMNPQTVTNYELPFSNKGSTIFDLFRQRPPDLQKYVFFLTDGHPNPTIQNEPAFINKNLDSLRKQGIRFFGVTIFEKTAHATVQAFATGTGGKSLVTTEKGLVDLFTYLALETQAKERCWISWLSPYGCSETSRNRTADITLKKLNNPKTKVAYTTPPSSVGSTKIDFPVLFCGDPNPGMKSQATVTIKAVGAPLTITGANIVPNGFFSVVDWGRGTGANPPFPFTLNPVPGDSVSIRVEFTQGAQQIFRQAQLVFEGKPCPPVVDLVGGQGFVLLNSPKGNEVFSTCDTVVISWSGVLPTAPVRIEYSDDGGTTWKLIKSDATGLTYRWLAPSPGTRYRVRVSVAPIPTYQWAVSAGEVENDSATSVAVAPTDLFVYTTGFFDGPFRVGTNYVNNQPGNIDGYFCQYDANGTLIQFKHLRGSGPGEEKVMGVVTDKDGNIYITGYYTSSSADFDGQALTKAAGDISNMFIYSFDKDFGFRWGAYGKGQGGNAANVQCSGVGIRYDVNGIPIICVYGTYARYGFFGYDASARRIESPRYTTNTRYNYYVTYDVNGTPLQFYDRATPPATFTLSKKKVNDSKGFTYETGSYTGQKTFTPSTPLIALNALGKSDAFLSKYGSTPASSDQSDTNFSVAAPELTFTVPSVTMDPTAQGQASSKSFSNILCNTGNFDVVIQSAAFQGANAADFTVLGTLRTVRLKPGECISIEIAFTPTAVGDRTAVLEVIGSCGTKATLVVNGTGLAPCLWVAKDVINLGKVSLGMNPPPFAIDDVLCNTGPSVLRGTLSYSGSTGVLSIPGAGVFNLDPSGTNKCLDITVNVNASTPGTHSITLDYGLVAKCGVPVTQIIVEVVEPKVTISDVFFGRQRVGNTVVDTIYIENQATQPANITALTPADPADRNLEFDLTYAGLPLVLQPGERSKIPVTFNPQARGTHTETISATVTGQQNALVGTASGIGFLPAIDAQGCDFTATTVNQTASPNLFVVIKNADSDSPLHIESVLLSKLVPDFTAINWPTGPWDLQPGDSLSLEVSFRPSVAGTRIDDVVIEHDAMPGPGPIPPYTTTIVKVTGVGIDQSVLPPVNFGDVLTCATKQVTVNITNPNPTADLVCNAPTATGDVGEFVIMAAGSFTLKPGEQRPVIVVFNPSDTRVFSAQFSYQNNQGLDIIINASGRGVTTNGNFTFGTTANISVGKPFSIPVNVAIGDMQGVRVTGVDITITYPGDYLGFSDISSSQAGWTFTPNTSTKGQLVLNGIADATATLVNGMVVTPTFETYLTADLKLSLNVSAMVTPDCVVPTGGTKDVDVEQVCYSEGRLIKVGANQFSMQPPQPNPAANVSHVRYTTGITVSTTFELVDGIGNVVRTITTPVLESGEYVLDLNTAEVGSGMYILRMVSGPYAATQMISVVK